MKKLLIFALLAISVCSEAQSWKAWTIGSWAQSDSALFWNPTTKKFEREIIPYASATSDGVLSSSKFTQFNNGTIYNTYIGSLTQLRALTSVNSKTTYISNSPGQEGAFQYDSLDVSTGDNTGLCLIAATNKRLKRIFNGPIQVDWFINKGTSDTTGCIANAIANSYSKTLAFTSGKTYKGSGWQIFDHIDIVVPSGTIVKSKAGSNNIFYIAVGGKNITIRGSGTLDGNYAGGGTVTNAISNGAASSKGRLKIDGLTIRNTGQYGIFLIDMDSVTIDHLNILNTKEEGIKVLGDTKVNYFLQVLNTNIDRSAQGASVHGYCLGIRGFMPAIYADSSTVSQCYAMANTYKGVQVNNCTATMPYNATTSLNCIEIWVDDLNFVNNKTYGGSLGTSFYGKGATIANCTAIHASSIGFELAVKHSSFSNCYNNSSNLTYSGGLNLHFAQDVTVVGFTSDSCFLSHIGILNSEGIAITGGTLTNTVTAVDVLNSKNITVTGVNVRHCQGAIAFDNVLGGNVVGNDFKDISNTWPVFLWAKDSLVDNISIKDNTWFDSKNNGTNMNNFVRVQDDAGSFGKNISVINNTNSIDWYDHRNKFGQIRTGAAPSSAYVFGKGSLWTDTLNAHFYLKQAARWVRIDSTGSGATYTAGHGIRINGTTIVDSIPSRTFTGTALTLAASDNSTIIYCTNSSLVTVTLPLSSVVKVAFKATIIKQGTGNVVFANGSGVTHTSANGDTIVTRYNAAFAYCADNSTAWSLIGGLGTPTSGGGGGGVPSGPAGGDLTGTYPNPTITTDAVTTTKILNANVTNAKLANSAVTINGTSVSLGASATISAAPNGAAGGDLSGTYPNPTVNTINGVTKNYYDPTSSIQTQLNKKQPIWLASNIKTANYTISTDTNLIRTNTTSGNVTITLPSAPSGNNRSVAVKMVIQGGTNTTTVACAGSDVFNRPGGGTSATLSISAQGNVLWYDQGVWTVLADDLPLTQLDTRYSTQVQALGAIYSNTSWSSGTGFVNNGTTPTFISNKPTFSSGTNDFSRTWDLDYLTCLDRWKIRAVVSFSTITATSYGMGIGIRSTNSYVNQGIAAFIDATSGGQKGKIYLGNTPSNQIASANAITFNAGDSIEIILERDQFTYRATVRNLIGNNNYADNSQTCTILKHTAGMGLNNTGRFCMYDLGGTWTLQSLQISSNQQKNVIVGAGDSRTHSGNVSSVGARWADRISEETGYLCIQAGGGDRTNELLSRINETVALAGITKTVILSIGTNDLGSGRTTTQLNTDYAALVAAYQAAGLTVYHLLINDNSAYSLTALHTYVIANYATANIIDARVLRPSDIDADLIHPLDAGHEKIARKIMSAFKVTRQTAPLYYTPDALMFVSKAGRPTASENITVSNTIGGLTNLTLGKNSTSTSPTIASTINLNLSNGGGSAVYGVFNGTQVMNFGINVNGNYSGFANANSGRQTTIDDPITGVRRLGVDQNGKVWIGNSSTTFGTNFDQVGNATFGQGNSNVIHTFQTAAGQYAVANYFVGASGAYSIGFTMGAAYGGTPGGITGKSWSITDLAGTPTNVLGVGPSRDLSIGISNTSYYARFGPSGNFFTGSASVAAINLAPHAAVTSPVNGDVWVDNTLNQVSARVNGTTVRLDNVAGGGITSLNGLTGATQTFGIGSSGTTPAFVSSSTTHTLNIPLAGSGVTSGTISNTTQTIDGAKTFNNTITTGGNLIGTATSFKVGRSNFINTEYTATAINTLVDDNNGGSNKQAFVLSDLTSGPSIIIGTDDNSLPSSSERRLKITNGANFEMTGGLASYFADYSGGTSARDILDRGNNDSRYLQLTGGTMTGNIGGASNFLVGRNGSTSYTKYNTDSIVTKVINGGLESGVRVGNAGSSTTTYSALYANSGTDFTVYKVGGAVMRGGMISYSSGSGAGTSGNQVLDRDANDTRYYQKTDITKGATTLTYNGSTTVFNIPHSLGSNPTSIGVTQADFAVTGFIPVITKDATNIIITYSSAPLSGSQVIYWQAFK